MNRRKFLVGVGSVSVGGSALIGAGAFSRVESQRSISIAVAEDPDAYLGLNGCRVDESPTPNSSYTEIDEKGHLAINMNPENETDAGGQGVNSNSRTWFDRVFQICNQGKEDICIYIDDHPDWPVFEDTGERRVNFYIEDDRNSSIVGVRSAIEIELGDCICVGLRTTTKELVQGDELLEALNNEITIIADVECEELEPPVECVDCTVDGDAARLQHITFQNTGGEKDIRVEDRGTAGNHIDLFDGTVGTGQEFSVEARITGPPNLRIYVDGDLVPIRHPEDTTDQNDFHISCSKTVSPGQRLHPDDPPGSEIIVVSAIDRDGIEIC